MAESNHKQSQAITGTLRPYKKNQALVFLCPSAQQKGAIVVFCILYFSNNSVYTFNAIVIRFLENF